MHPPTSCCLMWWNVCRYSSLCMPLTVTSCIWRRSWCSVVVSRVFAPPHTHTPTRTIFYLLRLSKYFSTHFGFRLGLLDHTHPYIGSMNRQTTRPLIVGRSLFDSGSFWRLQCWPPLNSAKLIIFLLKLHHLLDELQILNINGFLSWGNS